MEGGVNNVELPFGFPNYNLTYIFQPPPPVKLTQSISRNAALGGIENVKFSSGYLNLHFTLSRPLPPAPSWWGVNRKSVIVSYLFDVLGG